MSGLNESMAICKLVGVCADQLAVRCCLMWRPVGRGWTMADFRSKSANLLGTEGMTAESSDGWSARHHCLRGTTILRIGRQSCCGGLRWPPGCDNHPSFLSTYPLTHEWQPWLGKSHLTVLHVRAYTGYACLGDVIQQWFFQMGNLTYAIAISTPRFP